MSNIPLKYLFLSLGILFAGSFGGRAVTYRLAGKDDSIEFVYWSILIAGGLLLIQAVLCFRAKRGLYSHLIFVAAFGLSIVWFMMCLVLPVMWIEAVSLYFRVGMLSLLVPLGIANILEAFRRFSVKWAERGEQIFAKEYKHEHATVNWYQVTKSLDLTGVIFIPGLPQRLVWLPSLLIIPSMLAGLSLRNVYPIFSIFAWGIPTLLIVSFFFQMIAYNLAQAAVVRKLEKKVGSVIQSVQ